MPFSVEAKLEGVEQVIAALKALPAKLARRALRQAVAAGTRRLAKEAKQLAPVRRSWKKGAVLTGTLKRSIGSKVVSYPSGAVVGVVGARKGFRRQVGVARVDSRPGTRYPRNAGTPIYANPEKYMHLAELGTVRSRAAGFLSRALRVTGAEVRAAITESVNKALQRELAR